MVNVKHRRISVKTRNSEVIHKIMNSDATSDELSKEYGVQWATIRDSIRDQHYQVVSRPHNENRYQAFLAKVKKNNAAAAARHTEEVSSNDNTGVEPSKTSEETAIDTTNIAANSDKKLVYLVETGYLLHSDFDKLLAMDNGTAVFMVPRFCINELKKMSQKRENVPVKAQAKNVLMRIYSEEVWQKRIIPFEPVEQGMIPKTPDIQSYKLRSFGIAEAALELYLDCDYRVNVLTNAMEVQHLIARLTKAEDLSDAITVTRVYGN